jgi:hypothetical protein
MHTIGLCNLRLLNAAAPEALRLSVDSCQSLQRHGYHTPMNAHRKECVPGSNGMEHAVSSEPDAELAPRSRI